MSNSYIHDLVIAKGLKYWRVKKQPEFMLVVVAERCNSRYYQRAAGGIIIQ